MVSPFVRQLGYQSGVQLNPLVDNTDGVDLGNADQIIAIPMRATRGRIDKAFEVTKSTFTRKLGRGEPLRNSVLNEAHIQVGEALSNGAYKAVVSRLTTSAAALSYIVLSLGSGAVLAATVTGGAISAISVTNGGTNYKNPPTISIGGVGTGATATATTVGGVITAVTVNTQGSGYVAGSTTVVANPNIDFAVSPVIPGTPYILAIKHLECHNDGLIVEAHADQTLLAGLPVANSLISLKLRDSAGVLLYEFSGSLLPAQDDYGQSLLLTDVVDRATQDVTVSVGSVTAIPPGSNAYGRDLNGTNISAVSPVQMYFTEGGTGYAAADYQRAVDVLKKTSIDYGYLISGGNQAAALLSRLVQLAKDTNTIFAFDLDGSLSPDAAATQLAQLNIDSHYVHAYWSPLKSDDPLGINGKVLLGTSALNVALRCARNALTNAKGFAPKNYPIAGKAFPVNRTGIVQIYDISETEMSDLAKAKINPVIFQTYNGGGKYVFFDSLTCAQVSTSFKKLISVAEMSSSIDDWVTMFAKESLQMPMAVAVKKTNDFLKALFESAESSGWIKPSDQMGGAAFQYSVAPNQQKPADRMDVSYSLRYDGTARQIVVTQTLSR